MVGGNNSRASGALLYCPDLLAIIQVYAQIFYKAILTKAPAGETLTDTDQQRGCPTDVHNTAKYLLDLIESRNSDYGIKHFTDGEAMSWYEFAERILKDSGYRLKIDLQRGENYRTFARRPENSILK